MRAALFMIVAALLVVAALLGCGPRMDDQASLQAYEEAMPPMPEGSVARAGGDLIPGEEAAALVNPFPPTPANQARGAALFAVYCIACHGASGHGDGPVAGPLGVEVRDLTGEHVAALTDGEIFRTITSGNGAMLGLRGLIAPEERWLIVLAVRAHAQAGGSARRPARSACGPLARSADRVLRSAPLLHDPRRGVVP